MDGRSKAGDGRSIIWIAEDHDPTESFLLTGRFSGYFDRGNELVEQFEDLSADDAIAWGRERAPVVLIRTGDSDYYSAGELNPDPDETELWPPPDLHLGRRRACGFEALDNTEDDEPVLWDVRVDAELPAGTDALPFHEAIRVHPDTKAVKAPAPGYGPVSAAFLVETATHAQATAMAAAILRGALAVTERNAPGAPALFMSGYEVYPYRPGRSVKGDGVTY